MQSLRLNNSRILRIKNEKLSEYYFYMNKNIQGDFQICISVPLNSLIIIRSEIWRQSHGSRNNYFGLMKREVFVSKSRSASKGKLRYTKILPNKRELAVTLVQCEVLSS